MTRLYVVLAVMSIVAGCARGAVTPGVGLHRQARVLEESSLEASRAGSLAQAAGLESQALALYRQLDATRDVVAALNRLGRLRLGQGDVAAATRDFAEAYQLADVTADFPGKAAAANNLGSLARHNGNSDLAERRFTEAIAMQGASERTRATGLNNRALLRFSEGDLSSARQDLVAAMAIDRSSGDRSGQALRLRNLATVDLEQGDLEGAIERLTRAHGINTSQEDAEAIARDLELLAMARWRQGSDARQALSERRRSYEIDRLSSRSDSATRQRGAIEGWCAQWAGSPIPVDCVFESVGP